MCFLEFPCILYTLAKVGNLISASSSSSYSKTSLCICTFSFHVLLKLSWKDFEYNLTSVEDECNCLVVWTFFGITLLFNCSENWPFPVLWPLLSFTNLLRCWVQHFNSIIFRTFYSLAEISSPPLALFIIMLPKAHSISHSRMFGSRWVNTPSWLLRMFVRYICMYVYVFILILDVFCLTGSWWKYLSFLANGISQCKSFQNFVFF